MQRVVSEKCSNCGRGRKESQASFSKGIVNSAVTFTVTGGLGGLNNPTDEKCSFCNKGEVHITPKGKKFCPVCGRCPECGQSGQL